MIINHNISALNTYRQLSINVTAGNRSLEKLSSGYRINRAGDDAAGLAISEKMRGQIRGLNMASKNAQDGISLIQTAEGALNETHSILQRMRELAVQAANGTNTDADRAEIQKEIEQLKSEINRISTDTEFNTKKLLDGSIANSAKIDPEANAAKLVGIEVMNDNLVAGDYTVTITNATTKAVLDTDNNGTGASSAALTGDVAMGVYTLELKANGDYFDLILTNADGEVVDTVYNEEIVQATVDTVEIGGITFTWAAGAAAAEGSVEVTVSADFTVSVADAEGKEIGATTVADNSNGFVNVGGFKVSFDSNLTSGATGAATSVTVKTDAVSFQIGANEGQMTKLAISDMSSEALKVDAIDLTTADSASKAITTIDEAIQKVSAERAKLGAIQNRLDHTINNLGTSSENLTAAESRIRDVDMAKEMMEYAKNTILQQAAQAMLAQANQLPQGVLQLLR